MLNQGWHNAFTASVLAALIFFVIPKACGGEVDEEMAESAECFILWNGREYAIDCSADEAAQTEDDDTDPSEM